MSVASVEAWHLRRDPTGGVPLLRAIIARIVSIVSGGGRRRPTAGRRGPIDRLLAAVRGLFGGRRHR